MNRFSPEEGTLPSSGRVTILLLLVAAIATAGCSSYTGKMQQSRDCYYAGDYEAAIIGLDKLVEKSSDNDIYLYLLERGKTRLAFGQYDSAIVDFQAAEKRFHEIEGTVSVSGAVKSAIISDTHTEYQPADHEKILINTYLLLAYWLRGDREGAYVERNRVVNRLRQYTDGLSEEDWKKLDVPFARYLVALLYEMEGLVDDARIEYDEIEALHPGLRPEGERDGLTEVVVFAETGRAPVIVSQSIKGYFNKENGVLLGFFTVPGYDKPLSFAAGGLTSFDSEDLGVVFSFSFPRNIRQPKLVCGCGVVIDSMEVAQTKRLDSTEEKAMEVFDRNIGKILVKAAIRAYIKLTAQTKLKDKAGGAFDLLGKFLSAVETADTRSWQTLPAEIHLFRMEIEPGEHKLQLNYYNEAGEKLGTSRCVKFSVEEREKAVLYLPGPP